MGITHIRLAAADEDTLAGVLHTAWKLRVEKNKKPGGKGRVAAKSKSTAKTSSRERR
jgi:hypothetical protein